MNESESRTALAALMVIAGSTVREASRKYDLSEAGVRSAVKKIRDRVTSESGKCPKCNAPVDKDGKYRDQ